MAGIEEQEWEGNGVELTEREGKWKWRKVDES